MPEGVDAVVESIDIFEGRSEPTTSILPNFRRPGSSMVVGPSDHQVRGAQVIGHSMLAALKNFRVERRNPVAGNSRYARKTPHVQTAPRCLTERLNAVNGLSDNRSPR
jgi:hypothetical protein